MKQHRRYAPHEMCDLEDSVCRASHAAAMALLAVESVTTGGMQVTEIPLSKDERELLYFAVGEVCDYAAKARTDFYKLGEWASMANCKLWKYLASRDAGLRPLLYNLRAWLFRSENPRRLWFPNGAYKVFSERLSGRRCQIFDRQSANSRQT